MLLALVFCSVVHVHLLQSGLKMMYLRAFLVLQIHSEELLILFILFNLFDVRCCASFSLNCSKSMLKYIFLLCFRHPHVVAMSSSFPNTNVSVTSL